jgi:hypothetical protein
VRKPPLTQTPQRPPHAEFHTTGCPLKNSAGFLGAQFGGTSPCAGAGGGGGGSALAGAAAPRPRTAAVSPPATATAGRTVLIKFMNVTLALGLDKGISTRETARAEPGRATGPFTWCPGQHIVDARLPAP